ncbi:MAG: hypothetical protein LBI65_00960 [Candidatus Symbiothrix sp.]|jgi:hypothetical protein|nr:hypothetical protein [Candidatus Symbiothrix sp.]
MKTTVKIRLILLCLLFPASLPAQVTIGSATAPDPAVLLQIKEYEPAPGSGAATAGRGILLPRLKLTGSTDITNIAGTGPDKKKDLTGLLVYNVNATSEMAEGIYEWDGQEWVALEILSDEEGAYTQKALLRAPFLNESNAPVVTVGRFSFRFSPDKKAQCKLKTVPAANETAGFHIGRFWDTDISSTQASTAGYAYDSKIITFPANSSAWQNLHSLPMSGDERWEIWLADAVMNRVYNVQFIIFTVAAIPTYIILVTEY